MSGLLTRARADNQRRLAAGFSGRKGAMMEMNTIEPIGSYQIDT
jgi:hypothetical protein